MVDGQIGYLETVQCLVLKRELEVAVIQSHLVEERTAVAQLLKT